MGYKVKWVEDNLGISRKALRNFEKYGLMPANEGGGYRDYSDEDIDRIWKIRLFQGMGYSLKELVNLANDETFDFEKSLGDKIKDLERKKEEIERHIGYAKAIKLSGRIPAPKVMGSITFGDFYEKSLSHWNVNADPDTKKYYEFFEDLVLNAPEGELRKTDLGRLISALMELQESKYNFDSAFTEKVILHEILKRIDKGPNDDEVQLLIKMLFENRRNLMPELTDLTQEQFVRIESSSYIFGDFALIREREYGKDGCLFIANAIAVFGGYNCYDEVEN